MNFSSTTSHRSQRSSSPFRSTSQTLTPSSHSSQPRIMTSASVWLSAHTPSLYSDIHDRLRGMWYRVSAELDIRAVDTHQSRINCLLTHAQLSLLHNEISKRIAQSVVFLLKCERRCGIRASWQLVIVSSDIIQRSNHMPAIQFSTAASHGQTPPCRSPRRQAAHQSFLHRWTSFLFWKTSRRQKSCNLSEEHEIHHLKS